MAFVAYYRGTEDELLRARIRDFADRHGIKLVLVLHDEEGEYGAFRQLQNLIKLRECSGVIVPTFSHLGEDRYVMLENELFIKRNGAKLIFISHEGLDRRHAMISAVKRLSCFVTDWDADYGTELPFRNSGRPFKRIPPIGYRISGGEAVASPREAQAVMNIFDSYAEGASIAEICHANEAALSGRGEKLGNMTVKTILNNERYLGRISQKGYRLEPIVTYAQWLRVKERLERDYPVPAPLDTYLYGIRSDKPCSYVRKGEDGRALGSIVRPKGYVLELNKLEAETERIIEGLCSDPRALDRLVEYARKERSAAEKAYKTAVIANNQLLNDFKLKLRRLLDGERSRELQDELERLSDLKSVYGMRVRRIRSENELFSVADEDIAVFLERAKRMSGLSREEKAFIAEAFRACAVFAENEAFIMTASPIDGRMKRHRAEGIIQH